MVKYIQNKDENQFLDTKPDGFYTEDQFAEFIWLA